jgi:RND family efflux transporter MFP subunit
VARRGSWRRPLLGIACVPCLLLAACGQKEEAGHEEVARPVKIFEIGAGGAGGTKEYPGKLRAWKHVDMAFEVPGRIVEFPYVEGTEVEKGAVLARLDARDYEAELEKARALFTKAEADQKRYQILFDEGVSPKVELERAQRAYDVSRASLRQAEKQVEDSVLVAPFDGVLARKLVQDLENVQAKQPVLVFQDASRFKITVAVPEADLGGRRAERPDFEAVNRRIQPRVVVSAAPDESFPAELAELATTADPTTRTFDATFYMDRPANTSILPGMTAKVIVKMGWSEPGVTWVPVQAVWGGDEGGDFVWKVDPTTLTVQRAAVELGPLSGSDAQIVSGLAPGDWIAVSGIQELRDGMTVRRFEP